MRDICDACGAKNAKCASYFGGTGNFHWDHSDMSLCDSCGGLARSLASACSKTIYISDVKKFLEDSDA